jgi:chromosome segregation ATPase
MVANNKIPFSGAMGLFDERATLSKLEGYLVGTSAPTRAARPATGANRQNEADSYDEELAAIENGRDDDEYDDDEEEEEEYDDDQSSAYSAIEEEVVKVSNELVTTQSKLYKSETNLKERDNRLEALQRNLRMKEKELKDVIVEKNILIREIERLNEDMEEKDFGRRRPELENRLRKAVEFLKKDLAESQKKYAASQMEVKSRQSKIEYLEQKYERLQKEMEKLEEHNKSSQEKLLQMDEAREETTRLTEEVAELRERLRGSQQRANENQAVVERNISDRVKEKIRLEVREEVTKHVTERTERRIRAEMQLAHDKEINLLRAEFKKIFREHSILKKQVDDSKTDVTKAERLEQQFPVLKDEINRLRKELELTKEDHEKTIDELESRYRSQIQIIKEEAAKEKWEHGTEIRKQISKERDKEVRDFTQRIEVLSKQTDRLLQRAEREKEEYADQVRKRISQEKQREIQILADKLAEITKESEDLLEEAGKDKDTYAEQIRKQMTEEKTRELNKQSYRIEVLTSEKDALLKRIDAFEQELSWTWQEQEKNIEKITSTETALKSAEDELFKLKRSNQNLVGLVERYKKEHEDATKDFKEAKDHFRSELLNSEETIFNLKDKIQNLESELEAARNKHTSTLRQLESLKASAANVNVGDDDISLVTVPEDDVCSETSSVTTMLSAIETEKIRLRQKRKKMRGSRGDGRIQEKRATGGVLPGEGHYTTGEHSTSTDTNISSHSLGISTRAVASGKAAVDSEGHEILVEQLRSTSAENIRLQRELKSTTSDLQGKDGELAELRDALTNNQSENINLKGTIDELTLSLNACKKELVRVTDELETSKASSSLVRTYEQAIEDLKRQVEESKSKASKQLADSVAMYKREIESLTECLKQANTRMECCQCKNPNDGVIAEQESDEESINEDEESSTVDSNETSRLDHEIMALKSMIKEHKREYTEQNGSDDEEEDNTHDDDQRESCFSEDIAKKKQQVDMLKEKVEATKEKHYDYEQQIKTMARAMEANKITIQEYNNHEKVLSSSLELMSKRVKELELLLEAGSKQESAETEALKAENRILNEKVQELEKLLKEYSVRLSETSEELIESKQELTSSGESINHLRQRVENLSKMLEEKDKILNTKNMVSEEAKKKLGFQVEVSQNEIHELQSQVEQLKFVLGQTHAELQASIDQEAKSRDLLEKKALHASNKSKHLQAQNQQLQQELERCETEKLGIVKQLEHSKRSSGEKLTNSEKTIIQLNKRIESLSETLATSEKELQDSIHDLEKSNQELDGALEQSCREYEEKIKELQELVNAMGSEKDMLTKELNSLETDLKNARKELQVQKEKSDEELQKLQSEVVTCNSENLEVAKELQHSRQLFREALIAWRVETRDLTQQLDVFRGTEHWQSNHSRESLSVQSSQQFSRESRHSRGNSILKTDIKREENNVREERNADDADSTNDNVSYDAPKAVSPGKVQASKFFKNLLNANTEEDEVMAGIYLQETCIQETSRSNIALQERNPGWTNNKEPERDESVSTVGSGSIMTYVSQKTVPRVRSDLCKKSVRWMDGVEREPHWERSNLSITSVHNHTRKIDAQPDVDRVTEKRQECEDEGSKDGSMDTNAACSAGSRAGGTFSEDGSLKGSKLLPPRQAHNAFPLHSNRFQEFRRSQQAQKERQKQEEEQLEQSESRDDTVQSRDSAFFSYTYSSTSNYSRDDQDYSDQSDTDDNSHSYGSVVNNSSRHQEQSSCSKLMQLRQASSLDNNVNGIAVSRARLQPDSARAWSPRFMNLFAKQREAVTDNRMATLLLPGYLSTASGDSSSSQDGSQSFSNHSHVANDKLVDSKPLPYDEQTEEVTEELPFDQAEVLETSVHMRDSETSGSMEVELEPRCDEPDCLSVSLVENSTVSNSEFESVAVDTMSV